MDAEGFSGFDAEADFLEAIADLAGLPDLARARQRREIAARFKVSLNEVDAAVKRSRKDFGAEKRKQERESRQATPGAPPMILVEKGALAEMVDAGETALINSPAGIFQRGGRLVRAGSIETDAADGRKTRASALLEIDAPALRDELGRCSVWCKPLGKGLEPADPPREVAELIASRAGRWRFSTVTGIAACPTLRRDGSILREPGYDPATGLFLALDADFSMPVIPEHPTRDDAEAALSTIEALFEEFQVVAYSDRSVALSLVLSGVCRAALDRVPIHCFGAVAPSSGKSFLIDLAAAIVTGRDAPALAAGKDEIETEKRLAAKLLEGTAFISIDNCNGPLESDLLCQLVTQGTVSVRVLGESRTPDWNFRGIICANGNGPLPSGDLTRRVLLGELDPKMEHPELKQFRRDPLEAVRADRGRYIAAALVIARAYLAAGCPGRLPVLQSFGRWSDLVRSALVWLGRADPVATQGKAAEGDPRRQQATALLVAWRTAFGGEALSAAEAVHRLRALDPGAPEDAPLGRLRDAAEAVAGERAGTISPARLGNFLRRLRGQRIDGLVLVGNADPHDKMLRWQVGRAEAPAEADEIVI